MFTDLFSRQSATTQAHRCTAGLDRHMGCKLVLFHTKCLFASDREQNCVSDQKAAPATLSLLVSSGCYFEATLPPSFGMWLAPHMCKMQLAGVNGSETWNKPVDETWRCVLILSHKHWWCPNNSSFWGFFFFNLSHTFLCFLLLLPIWHVLDFRGHSFHHALVTKKNKIYDSSCSASMTTVS